MIDVGYIGIDPGKAGAIAIINSSGAVLSFIDMPLTATKEIDGEAIYSFFKKNFDVYNKERYFCILELAQAMPQQGVVSVFNYGKGFGKIQSVLEILKISTQEIRPMAWKKEFSLVKTDKVESVAKAVKMFPEVEFFTKRGRMLDGLAEAFLLAEFCRRKHNKGNI